MKLGIIADPHVSLDGGEASWHNPYRLTDAHDRLDAALADPLLADAQVLALLGDLAHFGDRESIRRCIDAVVKARGDRPAVLLSGNHDVLQPGVTLAGEMDEFTGAFDPSTLFAAAGFGLHVHDVTALTDRSVYPFDVTARSVVSDGPNGHVVLTHFPLLSLRRRAREAELLYSGHLSDLAPPVAPLPTDAPSVVLSGHLHLRGVAYEGDVLQLAFAALVEPPYELAVVDLDRDGDTLDVRYRCASAREPDAEKLPILDPETGHVRWRPGQGWHQPR